MEKVSLDIFSLGIWCPLQANNCFNHWGHCIFFCAHENMFNISLTDIMLSALALLSVTGEWAVHAVILDLSKLYSDFSGSLVRVFSFYCVLHQMSIQSRRLILTASKNRHTWVYCKCLGARRESKVFHKPHSFCQNDLCQSLLVLHWTVPNSKYSNLFFAYEVSLLDNSIQEWNCFPTQRKLLDVWSLA